MLSWSWKLGRVAGIPIYVHWTFAILIGWFLLAGTMENQDLGQGLAEAGFVLALFGCVVLHELGHALTAKQFGVPTSDITLLPIGGVARLQRIPDKPVQELLVALAGPAVNLVIVLVLWLVFGVSAPSTLDGREFVHAGFWPKLLVVNIILALFNMLPAFPMDGGRVLRALLAMRLPYARATRLAASIGQFLAIGFGLIGLSGHAPLLLFIAIFVWIGAEAEARQVAERAALKGVTVREAMLTDFYVLQADDDLGRAVDLLLAGTQDAFPVVAEAGDSRVLTRSNLMTGLSQKGREGLAIEFAGASIPSVEAGSPLISAMAKLRRGGAPCLSVVDEGRIVGLLTLENIGELLMVREALGETGDGSVAGEENIY